MENMKVIEMPGDNHCGYHALIFGLKYLNNPKINSNETIKNQILNMKSILIREYENKNSARATKLKLHPNEWLDDSDMTILSNYFNICIKIYDERMDTLRKQNIENDSAPVVTEIGPTGCDQRIYVIQKQNHFDVLLPSNVEINQTVSESVQITKKDIDSYMKSEDVVQQNEIFNEENEFFDSVNVITPKTIDVEKYPRRKTYADIVRRDSILTDEEMGELVQQKLHENLFPTWLR